jgi:hypothetical protein
VKATGIFLAVKVLIYNRLNGITGDANAAEKNMTRSIG